MIIGEGKTAIKTTQMGFRSYPVTQTFRLMNNEKQIWDLPIVDSSNKLIGLLHRHDVS